MCETDYPHSDSTWPDCIGVVKHLIDHLPASGAVQDPAGQCRAVVPLHSRRATGAGACLNRAGALHGKSAVITGAGSGVGRASALRFAAEGAKVLCADLRGDSAKETVRQIEAEGGVARRARVRRLTRRAGCRDDRSGRRALRSTRHPLQQRRHPDTPARDVLRGAQRRRLRPARGGEPARRVPRVQARRDPVQEAGRWRRDPQHRVHRRSRRLGRHRLRGDQGRCAPAHAGGGDRVRAVRHPRRMPSVRRRCRTRTSRRPAG